MTLVDSAQLTSYRCELKHFISSQAEAVLPVLQNEVEPLRFRYFV